MNIDEFKINIERRVIACIESISKDNSFFDPSIKRYELRLNKGHETILLCNSAVIRVKQFKSKEPRLELPKKYIDLSGLQNLAKYTDSEINWGKLPFTESVTTQVINNIKAIFEQCYMDESVESFGCCSRYNECSNEMKCLHPDIKFAKGCIYKTHLENGRIFYGKNRNIDHLFDGHSQNKSVEVTDSVCQSSFEFES